jgi:paraquat-inducible protein A
VCYRRPDVDTHNTIPVSRPLLIRGLIVASLALLVTGAVVPLLTTERFYFFSNTFSLASGIRQLVANDQLLIAAVVILFSFCVPVVKAGVIWVAASEHATGKRLLAVADRFGKWSMLEVFIAALLLVALKLGPVVDATLHYGAWLLAASVLLSGIASQLLSHEPHGGPLFSSPATLTVGAIGGAVAATILIGLLNPELLRFEALLGTPETRCIQRTLRLDRVYAVASESESDYASNLTTIDTNRCPEDFREAFGEYVEAFETLASLEPERESEPSLLDRAGAMIGLVATRDGTLEDIEETWVEVERVALEHGIEAPTK